MAHPTRIFRNVRGSFNKYLQSAFPTLAFNFGEADFDTGNLSRWVSVEYISRTLNVKPSLIVQLTFFAKDDRFGSKAEDICDQILDSLYEDPANCDLKSIPVLDWLAPSTDKPMVGAMQVRPRQANKAVVDQYGVTNIAVTVELRQTRI